MARDALAFIDALGLKQIDLLGFSLGGCVAQELVLLRPRLVRRLVLAGTAPQGGPDLHRWSENVYALATPDEPTAEDLLGLFFSGSEQSRAKGMESLACRHNATDACCQWRQRHDDAHAKQPAARWTPPERPAADLPDAGHGFLNQYPELFGDDVRAFLET